MDEPGWSWPAWKFGMKRSDLFTKLHDQYNTIPTPIQDEEAFHHDVYEISNFARSKDEFHRLLTKRKEQRLEELNSGLELASVKIISNPNLIGTDQWPLAIQLFRARSLDALVRYFSSYLPESQYESDAETLDSHSVHSDLSRSSTSTTSTAATDVNSEVATTTFFPEKGATHEPLSITTSLPPQEPLSPPSSDEDAESAASPTDVDSHDGDNFPINAPTPLSRSMSFSASESGRLPSYHHHRSSEEDASVDEYDTPCDDPAEIEADLSQPAMDDDFFEEEVAYTEEPSVTATATTITATAIITACDDVECDTPTPRPQLAGTTASYISIQLADHLRRSPSPSPRTRLAHAETRKSCSSLSPRMRKRELSPQVSRTPCEMFSRIQKPLSDPMRNPRQMRGRRRIEVE